MNGSMGGCKETSLSMILLNEKGEIVAPVLKRLIFWSGWFLLCLFPASVLAFIYVSTINLKIFVHGVACLVFACASFLRFLPERSLGRWVICLVDVTILCAAIVARHCLRYSTLCVLVLVFTTASLHALGQVFCPSSDMDYGDMIFGAILQISVYEVGNKNSRFGAIFQSSEAYNEWNVIGYAAVLVISVGAILYRFFSYSQPDTRVPLITHDQVKEGAVVDLELLMRDLFWYLVFSVCWWPAFLLALFYVVEILKFKHEAVVSAFYYSVAASPLIAVRFCWFLPDRPPLGRWVKCLVDLMILFAAIVARHCVPYRLIFILALVSSTAALQALGQLFRPTSYMSCRRDMMVGAIMQIFVYEAGNKHSLLGALVQSSSAYKICNVIAYVAVLVICVGVILYRFLYYSQPFTSTDPVVAQNDDMEAQLPPPSKS